jgi:hypothetical protein
VTSFDSVRTRSKRRSSIDLAQIFLVGHKKSTFMSLCRQFDTISRGELQTVSRSRRVVLPTHMAVLPDLPSRGGEASALERSLPSKVAEADRGDGNIVHAVAERDNNVNIDDDYDDDDVLDDDADVVEVGEDNDVQEIAPPGTAAPPALPGTLRAPLYAAYKKQPGKEYSYECRICHKTRTMRGTSGLMNNNNNLNSHLKTHKDLRAIVMEKEQTMSPDEAMSAAIFEVNTPESISIQAPSKSILLTPIPVLQSVKYWQGCWSRLHGRIRTRQRCGCGCD